MYAYCTLQLKINNFDDSWELFDSRLLIEKNKDKISNFDLIKNNLFKNLTINQDDKLLVLREQGIGEEVLFSSIYPDIINKFKNLKIEADKRLVPIFNRSFGKEIFVEDGYYSKNSKISDFDKIAYAGSLIKFFRKIQKGAKLEQDFKKLNINVEKNFPVILKDINLSRLSNNPVPVSQETIKKILLKR